MKLFVDDSHYQAKTYEGKSHGYQNPFYGLELLLVQILWIAMDINTQWLHSQ